MFITRTYGRSVVSCVSSKGTHGAMFIADVITRIHAVPVSRHGGDNATVRTDNRRTQSRRCVTRELAFPCVHPLTHVYARARARMYTAIHSVAMILGALKTLRRVALERVGQKGKDKDEGTTVPDDVPSSLPSALTQHLRHVALGDRDKISTLRGEISRRLSSVVDR